MSVSGNIITAPVGLREVYSLLGVAKQGTYYDVGYICSNAHGRINMWSKFKPVRLNKIQVDEEYDLDKYSDSGWDMRNGSKSWWYGGSLEQSPVFVVPVISEWKDIGVSGNQNENAQWRYKSPYGGDASPYRLTDFLGYCHTAVPPIVPKCPGQALLNSNMYFGVSLEDDSWWQYTLDDFKTLIGETNIYLGVRLYNHTKGWVATYSNSRALTDGDEDSQTIRYVLSGTTIRTPDNRNFTIAQNDKLSAWFFLCSIGGATSDASLGNRYSMRLTSDAVVHKQYVVGKVYIYATIYYSVSNVRITTSTQYANKYVQFDNDGFIYKIKGVISEPYFNCKVISVSVQGGTLPEVQCQKLKIIGVMQGTVNSSEVTLPMPPYGEFYSNAGLNLRNFNQTVNGWSSEDGTPTFTYYNSLSDLYARRNGATGYGIPIPSECIENTEDIGAIGVVTNPSLLIQLNAQVASTSNADLYWFRGSENKVYL